MKYLCFTYVSLFFIIFFDTLSHFLTHAQRFSKLQLFFSRSNFNSWRRETFGSRSTRPRTRPLPEWMRPKKINLKNRNEKMKVNGKSCCTVFDPSVAFFFQLWLFEMDYRLPLLVIILLKVEKNFLKKKKKVSSFSEKSEGCVGLDKRRVCISAILPKKLKKKPVQLISF